MGKTEFLRALDEAEFGAERTLNLRDSYPTANDARFRAEAWLRQSQAAGNNPVLVVTGRGKGSIDGVPVVKETVSALLHVLRRQGVVRSWQEHSQGGAFVIEMASMKDLLSAPRRHRDSKREKRHGSPPASAQFKGLDPETLMLLRRLAERTIAGLGVKDAEDMVESEMMTKLAILLRGIPESGDREGALRAVIIRALEELDAQKYE